MGPLSESPVQVPWLASLPSNTPVATQLGAIRELAEGALDPSDKDTRMEVETMLLAPVQTLEGNCS